MNIGYARVSTVDQSIDLQTDALNTFGCEEIYVDKSTGRDFSRKELSACLKSLRYGDKLVVWKLDRLGRSVKHLIETVQSLNKKGIEFISLTENIDTSSSGGKLVFIVFAALAEFERDLISERTKEGLVAARRRGRNGGRPKKLTESQIKVAKTLLKDPDQTVTSVAKHLGVARNTIYRNLNDYEA
jgi:DNA invertase Pin-like site-specific DNA recombinase